MVMMVIDSIFFVGICSLFFFVRIRIFIVLVCGKVICSDCPVNVAGVGNGLRVMIGAYVLRFIQGDAGRFFGISLSTFFMFYFLGSNKITHRTFVHT